MEKWTLNSAYYNFLNILKNAGKEVTRGHIKRTISVLCAEAGCTRESLGIYAGDRASMYFRGHWTSVSFDAVNQLAENGTDVIFIEKEGIPEVLTEYADKYGVAMVNTRGYLTEYGKDLMMAAKSLGAHVVIMTDYDITGIHIASHSPRDMAWIGVDDSTLEYFNLDRSILAVNATNTRLFKNVRGLVRNDARFANVDIDFLANERVEIDAILSQVGGERLWGYIQEKLVNIYTTRDYNRVVRMPPPDTLYPIPIQEMMTLLHDHVSKLTSNKENEIKDELSEVDGMIDVKEKEDEIQKKLQDVVDNDADMKEMVPVIKKTLEDLKENSQKEQHPPTDNSSLKTDSRD